MNKLYQYSGNQYIFIFRYIKNMNPNWRKQSFSDGDLIYIDF